jgi:hypothetical protein
MRTKWIAAVLTIVLVGVIFGLLIWFDISMELARDIAGTLFLIFLIVSIVVMALNSKDPKTTEWRRKWTPGTVGNLLCQLFGINVKKE